MTTFSYPLTVKRVNPGATAVTAAQSKVPSYLTAVVSVGMTGTAVGTTTIPLFVAPAGSRAVEGFIDVVTAFDNTANTNISLGVSGSTARSWLRPRPILRAVLVRLRRRLWFLPTPSSSRLTRLSRLLCPSRLQW